MKVKSTPDVEPQKPKNKRARKANRKKQMKADDEKLPDDRKFK